MSRRWWPGAIVAGLLYAAIGIGTAWLWRAGTAALHGRSRPAAWLLSAVVSLVHVTAERIGAGETSGVSARHAAAGVAIGAFGVAVSANLHRLTAGTGNGRMLAVSLVLWPIL